MEYREGALIGQVQAVTITEVATKATDYLLLLTTDDGSRVYCDAEGAARDVGIKLSGRRVVVRGWILPDLSGERPVYVSAESIEAAEEVIGS